MYLDLKNRFTIILIILSCQCVTIYTVHVIPAGYDYDFDLEKPEPNYCFLPAPTIDTHNMPILYMPNITGPKILIPDKNGNLFISNFDYFQFACSGGTFVSPTSAKGLTEITVQCVKGDVFGYKKREYKFDMYRCSHVPKADLVITNKTCQGIKNGLYAVGYPTKVNLLLYKMCFDTAIKRTLYTWHYVHAPVYKFVQTSKTIPQFVNSELLAGVNLRDIYHHQKKTVKQITNGTNFDTNEYINMDTGHFVRPSHLSSRNEFYYNFEQHATYFYENTVPLWSVFSKGIWREVKRIFERNLGKLAGKHLIISGTLNTTMIQLSYDKQKPFVLQPPGTIPVPQYVWKMFYNNKTKNGTVFIGINSRSMSNKSNKRFCKEIQCPGKLARKPSINHDLIFCCTKESFEKVYALDPIVYEEFLV